MYYFNYKSMIKRKTLKTGIKTTNPKKGGEIKVYTFKPCYKKYKDTFKPIIKN